jgi:Protein of unknown function (DUF2927)
MLSRVLCLFVLLCGASAPVLGQEPTFEQARDHIIAMFQAKYDEDDLNSITIEKWTVPIRYQLIGGNDRAKAAFAAEAEAFSRLTGLEIRPYQEGSGERPNVYYVFTRDIAEVAKSPLLRSVLKHHDETDAEYDKRTSEIAEQPMHRSIYLGDDSILLNVVIVDPSRMSSDVQTLMVYLFFATLCPVSTSDVIHPSIVNHSSTVHDLAPSDARFLRAIYSKQITFGMKLGDALSILAAAMARSDQ